MSLLPPVGPSLPMVSTELAVLGVLEDGAVVGGVAGDPDEALLVDVDAVLVGHPRPGLGTAPALDEIAVGVELHDRRRRRAALVARRLQRRAFLVVGERARPLQHPDMVVGSDRDARRPGRAASCSAAAWARTDRPGTAAGRRRRRRTRTRQHSSGRQGAPQRHASSFPPSFLSLRHRFRRLALVACQSFRMSRAWFFFGSIALSVPGTLAASSIT